MTNPVRSNNTYPITPSDPIRLLDDVDQTQIQFDPVYWDDIRVPASSVRVQGQDGSSPAVWKKYTFDATRGTNFSGLYLWELQAGDPAVGKWEDIHFTVQIPHSYKLGTDIYAHAHCGFLGGNNGKALLEFEAIWYNIGEDIVSPAATFIKTINFEATSAAKANAHNIVNFGKIEKTGIAGGISSMLVCRFSRITKKASWTYPELTGGLENDSFTGSVWFWEFDFHYEIDMPGSRQEFIK